MSLHYRPLRPRDIGACVQHIVAHPILGPRYGELIQQLPVAISRAILDDSVTINVFEESQGSTTTFLGAGMAVFVSDDFLHKAKTTPSFWIGPELVKCIVGGRSPLLSEAEVRDANSTGELNLMTWHLSCYPEDLRRVDLRMTISAAFVETFRGFRLKEMFAQLDSLEQLQAARNSGGFYFDRVKGYGSWPEVNAHNFSDEPRNMGITRELASRIAPSWACSLFVCNPPQIGFSRGEQRLLLSALGSAGTDEELSEGLGISVDAVKMAWRSIYDRVTACMPELLPDNASDGPVRGKQKRQHLLAYLRQHPEELRPTSRKLLEARLSGRSPSVNR